VAYGPDRWSLRPFHLSDEGGWTLSMDHLRSDCPQETRPRGGYCGLGSTLRFEFRLAGERWLAIRTDWSGGEMTLLPRR
jgi:hypothetical protein